MSVPRAGEISRGDVAVTVAPTIQFQSPIPSSQADQASMARQVQRSVEAAVNEVLAKQLRSGGILAR